MPCRRCPIFSILLLSMADGSLYSDSDLRRLPSWAACEESAKFSRVNGNHGRMKQLYTCHISHQLGQWPRSGDLTPYILDFGVSTPLVPLLLLLLLIELINEFINFSLNSLINSLNSLSYLVVTIMIIYMLNLSLFLKQVLKLYR